MKIKTLLLLMFVQIILVLTVKARNADSLGDHKNNYQYYDKKFDDYQKKLDDISKDSNTNIASAKQDIKDLLNSYLWGFGILCTVIAFAINFFGKKAIKDRVEEIIAQAAQGQVDIAVLNEINSRITTELISELIKEKSEQPLEALLKNLETKGESTINQFKAKGNEVLNSFIALPQTKEKDVEQSRGNSDEEINNQNINIRANEFFNLAFAAKHPKTRIELYKNVLELQPLNIGAFNNIGVAFNDLDRYTDAIEFR